MNDLSRGTLCKASLPVCIAWLFLVYAGAYYKHKRSDILLIRYEEKHEAHFFTARVYHR